MRIQPLSAFFGEQCMSVSEIPAITRRYLLKWFALLAGIFGRQKKQDDASGLTAQLHSTGFFRRHSSGILILLGALLLAYVGFEYTQMYWSQRRLEYEWARQQAQQGRDRGGATARPVALKDDGLTRLSIPSISFDAVVVEGTSNRALLLGPGHMEDTPAPGDTGNSVISGHRDTFFRHIHELAKGDRILVQRDGQTFHYEVTGKHIVPPTDLSVLQPSKDAQLTLITCYPTYYIGPAPERLVVTSKLISDPAPNSLSPPPAAAGATQPTSAR